MVKNLLAKAEVTGDTGLIPGSGRSPAGGDGNPLQCSRLENSMDRGAWGAHGVTESQTHTHTPDLTDCQGGSRIISFWFGLPGVSGPCDSEVLRETSPQLPSPPFLEAPALTQRKAPRN